MSRFVDMFECDVLRFLNREIDARQLRDKFAELIRWEAQPDDPEWVRDIELLMAEYDRGDRSDSGLRVEVLKIMDRSRRIAYVTYSTSQSGTTNVTITGPGTWHLNVQPYQEAT